MLKFLFLIKYDLVVLFTLLLNIDETFEYLYHRHLVCHFYKLPYHRYLGQYFIIMFLFYVHKIIIQYVH